MKRVIISSFFLCFLCIATFAKENIAMFVYGDIDSNDKFVIESKVSEQLSKNKSVNMLARSQDFLDMLTDEKVFQQSGEVSTSQMCTLGQLWGAKYIIGIMAIETRGQLMLTAKLINIATGTESFTISNHKTIKSANDLIYIGSLLGQNINTKLKSSLK